MPQQKTHFLDFETDIGASTTAGRGGQGAGQGGYFPAKGHDGPYSGSYLASSDHLPALKPSGRLRGAPIECVL